MADPIDIFNLRDANALERALNGATDVPADIAQLASTASSISSLSVPGPDPAFVASLGARIAAEAAAGGMSPSMGSPSSVPSNVVRLRSSWPKATAAGAAGLVAASAVLGVVSQDALPGSPLYGIRGVVDSLEATVSADRGATLLSQAREHMDDAQTLSGRTDRNAADISQALDDAAATVTAGEQALFDDFQAKHDAASLQQVRDFTVWAQPRLTHLSGTVPAESRTSLSALQAAVDAGAARLNAALASCGGACASVQPIPTPSATSTPSPTDGPTTSGSSNITPTPSTSATSPTAVPVVPSTGTRPTGSPSTGGGLTGWPTGGTGSTPADSPVAPWPPSNPGSAFVRPTQPAPVFPSWPTASVITPTVRPTAQPTVRPTTLPRPTAQPTNDGRSTARPTVTPTPTDRPTTSRPNPTHPTHPTHPTRPGSPTATPTGHLPTPNEPSRTVTPPADTPAPTTGPTSGSPAPTDTDTPSPTETTTITPAPTDSGTPTPSPSTSTTTPVPTDTATVTPSPTPTVAACGVVEDYFVKYRDEKKFNVHWQRAGVGMWNFRISQPMSTDWIGPVADTCHSEMIAKYPGVKGNK